QLAWFYAPRENVYVDPRSWDVAGLRATASYDFRFVDQVVHEDFMMVFGPPRVRRGGPGMGVGVSMGDVAWSMGAATRILDEIQQLAGRKRRVGRATLIDQPAFQRDFGMMRSSVDAARALIRRVFVDWYDDAAQHGTARL